MLVNVDISVFCDPSSSFGVLSGELCLPIAPAVGDRISFVNPLNKVDVRALQIFKGELTVKKTTLVPGKPGKVLYDLEDIVLQSEAEARQLVDYIVRGFGISFDPHHDL